MVVLEVKMIEEPGKFVKRKAWRESNGPKKGPKKTQTRAELKKVQWNLNVEFLTTVYYITRNSKEKNIKNCVVFA